jgi:hypothetical protein
MQSLETKTRPDAFESASHRLASAKFVAPKAPIQPSDELAAPLPTGRILQSLVESPAAWDPLSRALGRRPGRPRKEQGSQLAPALDVPCDLPARLANVEPVEGVVPPSDGIAVSAEEATAASNQVVQNSCVPKPRPKAKRRVQTTIALDAKPASASAKDQAIIRRTDASAAFPMAVDEPSCPKRKRTIVGRYVFGNELKPGERWKRRLIKGR